MAINVPNDFNYLTIGLDPLETSVRDDLGVHIENWAKFRHTITASASSSSLHSLNGIPIAYEVQSAFIELSKSHYEVVTLLGIVKSCLEDARRYHDDNRLLFKKSFKEFYIHSGGVLDNLARLIYIVNICAAPTEPGRFGALRRHEIGYGGLKSLLSNNRPELTGYTRIVKNRKMHEIRMVRNHFAHSWPPVIFNNNGTLMWPTAMRAKAQYYLWPHDEREKRLIRSKYKKKVPILEMLEEDWESLESFQNYVFKKISTDIRKFERNHNLEIRRGQD